MPGRKSDPALRHMNCPNCGNERSLSFCAHCGQNDRDYIRSLSALVSGIVRETFELDSRMFRTLRLLLLRPGELSAEFSRNRRASYSSPIRLYLFASLVFFFVLSVTTRPESPEERAVAIGFEAEKVPEAVDFAALQAALSPQRREKVDQIVSRDGYPGSRSLVYGLAHWANYREEKLTHVERFYLSQGVDWLHTPELAANRLAGNLPISMFFMLPVFALLLRIFYRKKRRFYVEHLVFSTHVHVVTFAVFTVLAILPETRIGGIPDAILLLALAAYHFAALLRYYGDGLALTAVKWSFLTLIYGIMLIPGFLLAVFVTLSAL